MYIYINIHQYILQKVKNGTHTHTKNKIKYIHTQMYINIYDKIDSYIYTSKYRKI